MPQHWINHALISFYRSPGQPISVLDGVPIAIKDEIDCCPYPTTGKLIQDSIYIYIYIYMCVCVFLIMNAPTVPTLD